MKSTWLAMAMMLATAGCHEDHTLGAIDSKEKRDVASACAGPNPQGCSGDSCGAGMSCLQIVDACHSSACSCDPTTRQWICTADCGGGICVADPTCPNAICALFCPNGYKKDDKGCDTCDCVDAPACAGPNPQGCTGSSCGPGMACVQTDDACHSSACSCDPTTALWTCTADCGGGICIPDVACPPVICTLSCPNGYKKDSLGCDKCECIDVPPLAKEGENCKTFGNPAWPDCEPGLVCQPDSARCVPACAPQACALACPHGFAKDAQGCEICACAP